MVDRRPKRTVLGIRFAPVVLAIAALLPACARSAGSPLPPPPLTVDVEMGQYRFFYAAPRLSGRLVLNLRNTDRLAHDLVLVELADDLPPFDEQLKGPTRKFAPIIANVPPQPPGSTSSLAVDLPPGRYGFVCFIRDPDGQQHAQKGMNSEFRIDQG